MGEGREILNLSQSFSEEGCAYGWMVKLCGTCIVNGVEPMEELF